MFWACDEKNPQQTSAQEATYRSSRSSSCSSRVAMVVARTTTPHHGQFRRLPRQAMHRGGASSPTIKNALSCLLFFLSDGRFLVFESVFRASVAASFGLHLFTCNMHNHSTVSTSHPTEDTEISTGCGNLRCYKVCCAVFTPQCAGRYACCAVRCSFVVLILLFQRPRDFGEEVKNARAHPMHPIVYPELGIGTDLWLFNRNPVFVADNRTF